MSEREIRRIESELQELERELAAPGLSVDDRVAIERDLDRVLERLDALSRENGRDIASMRVRADGLRRDLGVRNPAEADRIRVETTDRLERLERVLAESSEVLHTATEESGRVNRHMESLNGMRVENARSWAATTDASNLWMSSGNKQRIMANTIDLCLVLDITGSMSPWLIASRSKLESVVQRMKEQHPTKVLRVSFCGYRDFNDTEQYVLCDFTSNVRDIVNRLNSVIATGGGDAPEDVSGALERVLEFSWMGGTRVLVHIADAPAHGRMYNDFSRDDHPDASSSLSNYVAKLSRRVNYYFGKINESTNKMTNKFNEFYRGSGKQFTVCSFTAPDRDFIPVITNAITESMINSAASRIGATDIADIIEQVRALGLI